MPIRQSNEDIFSAEVSFFSLTPFRLYLVENKEQKREGEIRERNKGRMKEGGKKREKKFKNRWRKKI